MDRTGETGQVGQGNRDGTTMAGQPGYGSLDRTTETGQPEQVNLDQTAWTGEPGRTERTSQNMTARQGAAVLSQLSCASYPVPAILSRALLTLLWGAVARTGQPGHDSERRH